MKIKTTLAEEVMVPLIKVKDRCNGAVHIVGTNCHDALTINNGHIDYLNLQCCEGTELIDKGLPEDEGFEFVGGFDGFTGETYVEFVPLKEFIKIMEEEI